MSYVFGAHGEYSGPDLATAHAHLIRERGLKPAHFDIVAGHLQVALEGMGVAQVRQLVGRLGG